MLRAYEAVLALEEVNEGLRAEVERLQGPPDDQDEQAEPRGIL
jgi:hypothetical protein